MATIDTPTAAVLDPAALAAVSSLELRSRMIVEGVMTGMHRSPYFGFSVEFAQHRQYAPGDDIRHLDWKVFGRSDKLYLKQYQKETNLDLVLLVDTSGSMGYGREIQTQQGKRVWKKYDHAASLAAAMAYLAIKQQDRVGLVMFADQIQNVTRTSNSREHWRLIVDALRSSAAEAEKAAGASFDDQGRPQRLTDLSRMFDQVTAKLSRRSLIVLISDLFDDPTALERGLARIHYRRHDAMVLQVLDHAELTFPFRSPSEFFGMENEGKLPLDPAALREAYLESLQTHLKKVAEVTRRFGFDHELLDTAEPLGAPLSRFLARRASVADKRS